jgi:hypothetical protein
MTDQYIDPEILQAKLNLETAQIPWKELQRFFASGTAICVAAELDLTQVASVIAQDNATQLKAWMESGQVDAVTDQQAREWYQQDAVVWALVVKPWVLVQSASAG